jgi:hypothetical protein
VKKLTRQTRDYVNWLTHAKNAAHYDAEIGVTAVSQFLATVTASRLRWSSLGHGRCEQCGSYSMSAGRCQRCGSIDEDYAPPAIEQPTTEDLAALAWPTRALRAPTFRHS